MSKIDIKAYLASNKWLPWFMRDFHDQKDLFKTIEQKWPNSPDMDISWIRAHVYVVDRFLRFMAFHGYTLQKARVRDVQFGDIDHSLRSAEAERTQATVSILSNALSRDPQ